MYNREQALVDDLVQHLAGLAASPWGELTTTTEFFYGRGRADVVALTADGEVLAFEAKLTKWRDALHQAYRNRCFAHRSYVLLPDTKAHHAARYVDEFTRRSVGICYVSCGQIMIALDAEPTPPLQEWLSEEAKQAVISEHSDAAND